MPRTSRKRGGDLLVSKWKADRLASQFSSIFSKDDPVSMEIETVDGTSRAFVLVLRTRVITPRLYWKIAMLLTTCGAFKRAVWNLDTGEIRVA